VDGEWRWDVDAPCISDEEGNVNNILYPDMEESVGEVPLRFSQFALTLPQFIPVPNQKRRGKRHFKITRSPVKEKKEPPSNPPIPIFVYLNTVRYRIE